MKRIVGSAVVILSDDPAEAGKWARWFYRTHVKDPRDSVADIAEAEGVTETYVSAAIAEAEALLSTPLPGDPRTFDEAVEMMKRRAAGFRLTPRKPS